MKIGESGVGVSQNSAADVDSSTDSAVHFTVDLSPGAWHQVALGVRHRHVTLHVDCDVTMTSPWRRRAVDNGDDYDDDDDGGQIGSNIVLSIGKAFIESSRYPRFEVSSSRLNRTMHVKRSNNFS